MSEHEGPTPNQEETLTIPVIEEDIVAGTRSVKTGSVRVEKHVQHKVKTVDVPLLRETVEVRRVAMNRVVETPPKTRREGDTIIVPVVEEQLVVVKRLVLTEEIHLTTRRTREHARQEVTLEREQAEVKRIDAKGRVLMDSPGRVDRAPRRRGLLD